MRTIAIAKKVVKELLRDKRTLALMFVAPVFIMWLMNLMFSASTTVNVKLATQDGRLRTCQCQNLQRLGSS